MSTYLIFFGKSQDFTTYYYDRENPIHDFNAIIKDFDLLESKVFTIDDLKNKEILSRYFFTTQGKNYCLLKLYSFAQAYSGNRIAGSIYGAGLLCNQAIELSLNNLELLRATKDHFARLSLDGVKFNKSNFKYDSDRIWKAVISSNAGNLLDKIDTSAIKINGNGGSPISFFVQNLFSDAVKLNDRISSQDVVYFSEDFEHLKRTQNKWGGDSFPIYCEKNNQFEVYKEPVKEKKEQFNTDINSSDNIRTQVNDLSKLKLELSDCKYINRNLQYDFAKLKSKHKLFKYAILGLSLLIILSLIYIIFFTRDGKKKQEIQASTSQALELRHDPISIFLTDGKTVDSGIYFLKSVQFVNTFDVKKSVADSSKFHNSFKSIQNIASRKKILIDNITEVYHSKNTALKNMIASKSNPIIPKEK